jgi:hypothetical protein
MRESAENVEAFIQACIDGDEQTVKQQLIADRSLANALGRVHPDHREFMRTQGAEDGWTALHLASHYGRPGVVRLLVNFGADVNALALNSIGNTPLMAAIAGGHEAVVEDLLARGADPRKRDAGGNDALTLTYAEGREGLSAIIKEALARNS